MTLRVGVIGTGVMGADHVRTLREDTSGAALVAVCDADAARAQAVIIASPDATDAELAVACIAAMPSRPTPMINTATRTSMRLTPRCPWRENEGLCRRIYASSVLAVDIRDRCCRRYRPVW